MTTCTANNEQTRRIRVLQAGYLNEFHNAEGTLSTPEGGDLFSTVGGRLSVRLACDDGRKLDLELASLSLVEDEDLLLATDKGYWLCKVLEE